MKKNMFALVAFGLVCGIPAFAAGEAGEGAKKGQFEAEYRALRKAADKDGDGVLSEAERKALQSSVDAKLEEKYQAALDKAPSGEAKQKITARYQEIKGKISKARSVQADLISEYGNGKLKEKLQSLQKQADKDGDGKLSAEERSALQATVDAELAKVYQSALAKATDDKMKEAITARYNEIKAKIAAKRAEMAKNQ